MSEEVSWSSIQKEPLFDSDIFGRLVIALGANKAKEFSQSYIEACKEQTIELIEALNNKNYSKIEFNAHKLYSSTGTYGNMQLHHINGYIEEFAEKQQIPSELANKQGLQDFANIIQKSLSALEIHLIEI